MAKAAAMLAGASGVRDQLLALDEYWDGHLEHLDGCDLAVRREAQRIKAVELGPPALAAVKILDGRVLGPIIVLTRRSSWPRSARRRCRRSPYPAPRLQAP